MSNLTKHNHKKENNNMQAMNENKTATKFKTVEYTLPVYWASYLINGDASGMEDEEQAECDAFMAKHNLPDPVDVGEGEFSPWNDANSLGGEVATYTFLLPSA